MIRKNIGPILVIGFAVVFIAVNWYSIFTTPNVPMPIFQGVAITIFMALFAGGLVWAMSGGMLKIAQKRWERGSATAVESETYEVPRGTYRASRRYTGTNGKVRPKDIVRGVIVLGLFVLFVFVVLHFTTQPKEIASTDAVWDAIVEQGYTPDDITFAYQNKDEGFKKNLERCIAFEKDSIHFEFFEFKDDAGAQNIYSQAYSMIISEYNSAHSIEIEHRVANYCFYSIEAFEKYNVTLYVGNTAVYAYCDAEVKNEINKILDKIGYLNPD